MRVRNWSRTVVAANLCVSLRAFGYGGYNKLKVLNGFAWKRRGQDEEIGLCFIYFFY